MNPTTYYASKHSVLSPLGFLAWLAVIAFIIVGAFILINEVISFVDNVKGREAPLEPTDHIEHIEQVQCDCGAYHLIHP